MPPRDINDPEHWRGRAAKMRSLALTMRGTESDILLNDLAADYDKLADRAARQNGGRNRRQRVSPNRRPFTADRERTQTLERAHRNSLATLRAHDRQAAGSCCGKVEAGDRRKASISGHKVELNSHGQTSGQKMRKEHRSCVAISAAMVGFFAVTVSAFSFGLSDGDYDYLKAQHIERSEAPVLDLSPKERERLHNLINDPGTAHDQIVRNKNIKDSLAIILEHQLWEKAHPGELWDRPKK
jgi:hypothetical protein